MVDQFSEETATWLEVCIRVYQLLETFYTCIVHTHNTSFFTVPYHKSVKQKKWLSVLISACCSFNILVIRWALTWTYWTIRIPCLTSVDTNRKVLNLCFKVVDPKLQVADLKAEVGELRYGGIPPISPLSQNSNNITHITCTTCSTVYHRLTTSHTSP